MSSVFQDRPNTQHENDGEGYDSAGGIGLVALFARRQLVLAVDQEPDVLCDVGDVVADPLDVLGHEQQVRARGDHGGVDSGGERFLVRPSMVGRSAGRAAVPASSCAVACGRPSVDVQGSL